MDELKKETRRLGLVGKTTKEIDRKVYLKIWNYARSNNIWPAKLFVELGITPTRFEGVNSLERLDEFMEMLKYKGVLWSVIPMKHQVLISKCSRKIKIDMSALFSRYNIMRDKVVEYTSFQDIKDDLKRKGLSDASIKEIDRYDGSKTYANIQSFAERHNLLMDDVWTAVGMSYSSRVVRTETGIRMDFVYHSDGEMLDDFKAKGLTRKTILEVKSYDAEKTYARVIKYARRTKRPAASLWKMLGVRSTPRRKQTASFTSLTQLKKIVQSKNLKGRTIKDLRLQDPALWQEIKSWQQKSNISFDEIWKAVGLGRASKRYSFEEIVAEIEQKECDSPGELRKQYPSLYTQASHVVHREQLSLRDLWKRIGWKLPSQGRSYSKP